jgi:hypothetical protein
MEQEIEEALTELTTQLGLVVYSGQAQAIKNAISRLIDLKVKQALNKDKEEPVQEIKNGGNPKVSTVEIKRWR